MRCAVPAVAATTAGTVIDNTSTATFTDGGGNSLSTTSNTVTITVQNAPALTVTAPANQNVTPGMIAVDTFTLTNTGNTYAATGSFALSGDATFGGSGSGTLDGYVLNGAATGTCSIATPCAYATLNAQSGMKSKLAGATVTVGVEYTVSANASSGQTIQTTLSANASQLGLTGAVAETSANVTATPTDTVATDARLDVQAAASISGSNIVWTITANDGGGYNAQALAAAKAVLGTTYTGIAIFVPVPAFGGTSLAIQSAPSTPTLHGASGGTSAMALYNSAACSTHPASGWSSSGWSTAKCVAIYAYNAGSQILPSAPSGSSGAGSVTTAQITYSFTTNQPSGSGSGNANAVTLIASSAIGGATWATGAVPIVGQGLTVGSSTDASTASLLNNIQSNTTASSGTAPPGGASNQAGSNASLSYAVLHGPYGNAGATGWYPGAIGTPSADNMHDYTAYNVWCTSNGNAGVNGQACSVTGSGVGIINEVDNTGNATDTFLITATAPSGWTVQLYSVSSCSGGGSTWPSCTQGSSITSQSAAGGSASVSQGIASGGVLHYEALYRATGNSATPFTAFVARLTATGQSGSGTGGDTNDTFNVLYPGGPLQVTNAVSVTSANCPAGESPSNAGACPGGTLSYTIQYANVVPSAVGANLGTEPGFAYGACYLSAGSLVITDDGAANPSGAPSANNWATYTNGLAGAASDTTSNTVFTYYPSGSTTFSANQTKFAAQIGGASYQFSPGASGTITFTAVVK